MGSNGYHFITHWRVPGTVKEVADVLGDALALPTWWPAVYLEVTLREPGHPETWIGRRIELFTKGWLPYTLRWDFVVEENRYPYGATIRAEGDFIGRGVWHFRQDGEMVDVVYDWRIEAQKELLRRWSFVLKPVFAANHHWAMRQGLASLELELARRRARTDVERARIPAPPPPTFAWLVTRGRDSR